MVSPVWEWQMAGRDDTERSARYVPMYGTRGVDEEGAPSGGPWPVAVGLALVPLMPLVWWGLSWVLKALRGQGIGALKPRWCHRPARPWCRAAAPSHVPPVVRTRRLRLESRRNPWLEEMPHEDP